MRAAIVANGEQNGRRIPRVLFTYAWTPKCMIHRCPMVATTHEDKLVYFRCPRLMRDGKPCKSRGKAPRVKFLPEGKSPSAGQAPAAE